MNETSRSSQLPDEWINGIKECVHAVSSALRGCRLYGIDDIEGDVAGTDPVAVSDGSEPRGPAAGIGDKGQGIARDDSRGEPIALGAAVTRERRRQCARGCDG